MILPHDIISGQITSISYKTNPIQIEVKNHNGKITKLSFHDRHTYDAIVGKQKPEVGKKIYATLGDDRAIKHIKIT